MADQHDSDNEFPRVRHSHVVPQGYLRAWAEPTGIAMHLVGRDSSPPKVISTRDAGVRRTFYRRIRPSTGESIDDVEWSLSVLEDKAIRLVRRVTDVWPPSETEKTGLAQFIAAQYARGVAYAQWHHGMLLTGRRADVPTERVEDLIAMDRPMRILTHARSIGALLTSMHWRLVCFAKPRLITSDEPVVVWPLDRSPRRPVANRLASGIGQALEVFVPLSPTVFLLMTWINEHDCAIPTRGLGRHADTANSFVKANAQRQWFHLPSVRPTFASGPRIALSATFTPRYDAQAASVSPRRRKALDLALAEAERGPSNEPIRAIPMTADKPWNLEIAAPHQSCL